MRLSQKVRTASFLLIYFTPIREFFQLLNSPEDKLTFVTSYHLFKIAPFSFLLKNELYFIPNISSQICLLSLNELTMRNFYIFILTLLITGCNTQYDGMKKILFLHHSTGHSIWIGNTNRYIYKLTGKGDVQKFFDKYNKENKTEYLINELIFPKNAPYGWNNYPYDYYNIWVKNAGEKPYLEEPTLEILTKEYDIIIFKHCFPVSRISEDSGSADINSDIKSFENYILQYNALKTKMHDFPENRFIVWTPSVNTKTNMTENEALRTKQFYEWIINEWDEEGDNIFIWDFYAYETEGGLYLADNNAVSPDNSHPNKEFAARMVPLFCKYVIDVTESYSE
jgi:hypothetical protein